MKLYLIVIICFAVLNTSAQNKNSAESTIRKLEQKIVQAILDADTNTLKQLWAAVYVVNTPRNDLAKGRASVFQNQRSGYINYSSFERNIEEIQIQGNVAITFGNETFVPRQDIPGAKAGATIKRRFTNVWKKKQGKWVQIARHASVICSD